jgi:hypothetical protein
MFNENLGSKRGEWTFTYKAQELLPYAQRRLAQHQADEITARAKYAQMIQDPATFHRDDVLQHVKRDIDRYSALREQFQVYCYEFARKPDADFRLALSDIVFFGLVEPDNTESS